MELRIFTEPQQGASYDDLLSVAQAAEAGGFGAFFRSDHFVAFGEAPGLPGPTDAWITLGALARETTSIRLGTLVTSATFRLPGMLAIAVAQVDQMSGGRVELGLGAGWFETEHRAYGVPFPALGERFERLTEQLEVVTGLWSAHGPFSHAGEHYQLVDSPALPKPVQQPLPVIIGGAGTRRTPELAARFGQESNLAFHSVADTERAFARVAAACAPTGRQLHYSAAQVLCCGRDETEVARRAAAIGRAPEELRANGVAGRVDECIERLQEFSRIGADRVYLQVLDLHDLAHLELVASEVLPALG